MAPLIPSAEIRLSYPLYALDFDPQDANRLVVGGGGGAGGSGVGNQISVLDTSTKEALQVVSEIELSREEDSVNTIAVGPRKKNSVLVYAGINSSEDDIKKGKNEHFRVFSADLPSKTKAAAGGPKITEVSRSSFFTTKDSEAYQRVLRISQPYEGVKQIGAAATGVYRAAKDPQIAIFDIPSATGTLTAPKLRGNLELVKEAMDLDIIQISDDEYQLVYCDDYDIHTLDINNKGDSKDLYTVWTMPHDESMGAKARPSFRSIRYLTPTFVLCVANLPQAGGCVLQGFRLPNPADIGKEGKEGKARLALSVHLPKNVRRGTGLAVRNLSPPTTPSQQQGDAQFVIAVTGQDSSITLYTLEHQALAGLTLIANCHIITTLKEVHPGPISGLAFSNFVAPAASGSTKAPATVKLASIGSLGNTCVVHTLPLKKLAPPSTAVSSSVVKSLVPARYVVALKSHGPGHKGFLSFLAISAVLIALLAQALMEINGLAPPYLGTRHVVPAGWQAPYIKGLREEARLRKLQTEQEGGGGQLADILGQPAEGVPKVVIKEQGGWDSAAAAEAAEAAAEGGEGGVVKMVLKQEEGSEEITMVEEEKLDGGEKGKEWEELPVEQQELWKKALKKAGHWGEDVGEAVFKGVLFGEIGGLVGAFVRG
ncbi:hypothetical protein QBC41DRAFT_274625 [Cercophora samala]|uniref:Guanine nucleotide-exchange factor SEC12 n=1 Tax=Cercophora samala TaxID=330535 RepID=A0AA39ZFA4_9PEZI|nr:hypothetical protein QBC41DRAFT_274625 [Cercophora samala]